jgi:hypothetical protein
MPSKRVRDTYYTISPTCQLDERLAIIDMMGPGPYRFLRKETIRGVINLWLCVDGGPEYALASTTVEPCPHYHLASGSMSFEAAKERARQVLIGNSKRIDGWGLWVCRVHDCADGARPSLTYEWSYRWAPLDFEKHANSIPVEFKPVYLIRESVASLAA